MYLLALHIPLLSTFPSIFWLGSTVGNMGAGSYQQCCIRGSAACTLLYRTHRSPDACQVIPQIGVNWQSSVESAQQHHLLLAEVCFSLVAWAFCLRLRQKMSLLPLNLPSPSVLCPKATKLFTLHTEISLYFTAVFNCKVKWPTPLFDQVVLLKQDSICMGGGGGEDMFTLTTKHCPKGKVHSRIAFNPLDRGGQWQPFWS